MPARPFVDRPVGDVDAAPALARRVAATLGLPDPELMRVGHERVVPRRRRRDPGRASRARPPAWRSSSPIRCQRRGIAVADAACSPTSSSTVSWRRRCGSCWPPSAPDRLARGRCDRARRARVAGGDLPDGLPSSAADGFPVVGLRDDAGRRSAARSTPAARAGLRAGDRPQHELAAVRRRTRRLSRRCASRATW